MSVRRAASLAAVVALAAALVANAVVSFRSVGVLADGFDDEARPAEVQRTLLGLLSALQDAETGQRGYLLTGDRPYLEPYLDARPTADSLLARLDTLVSWNALQVGRMPGPPGHHRRQVRGAGRDGPALRHRGAGRGARRRADQPGQGVDGRRPRARGGDAGRGRPRPVAVRSAGRPRRSVRRGARRWSRQARWRRCWCCWGWARGAVGRRREREAARLAEAAEGLAVVQRRALDGARRARGGAGPRPRHAGPAGAAGEAGRHGPPDRRRGPRDQEPAQLRHQLRRAHDGPGRRGRQRRHRRAGRPVGGHPPERGQDRPPRPARRRDRAVDADPRPRRDRRARAGRPGRARAGGRGPGPGPRGRRRGGRRRRARAGTRPRRRAGRDARGAQPGRQRALRRPRAVRLRRPRLRPPGASRRPARRGPRRTPGRRRDRRRQRAGHPGRAVPAHLRAVRDDQGAGLGDRPGPVAGPRHRRRPRRLAASRSARPAAAPRSCSRCPWSRTTPATCSGESPARRGGSAPGN